MTAWRNSSRDYGTVSRILHWLTVPLVFIMMALGWGRGFAPGYWRPYMLEIHIGLGVLVLLLFIARMAWRLADVFPSMHATLSVPAARAARAVHAALYAFLFLMPLSGWLGASAMGREVSFFGLFALPPLLQKSRELVPVLKQAHNLIAWGFAALIALHVAAALIHHYISRDGILARMWPPLRKQP